MKKTKFAQLNPVIQSDNEEDRQSEGEFSSTKEKQNKYFSNQNYDTIKKRLVDLYPQGEGSTNQDLLSKKNKASFLISNNLVHSEQQVTNNVLIKQLQSQIRQYRPQFKCNVPIKKLNFTQVEIKGSEMSSNQLSNNPIQQREEINLKFNKQLLIKRASELIEDTPKRKVSNVDKQISSLYKENRNINLQYRRNKFMQIFTGTDKFSTQIKLNY